jgi:NTP pyrophosphatase (non-canonical NTP hydrolase)
MKMAEINYAKNIIDLLEKQRQKGISKYGAVLEDNTTLTSYQRIEHFEEELMDALMYAQHLKVVMRASLTANDFQRAAMRTASGMNYNNAGENGLLLNGVMGLNGEAGECIDILKKHIFQGHELDREHLIEELGDVAWYLAVCCEGLGVSLEEVMERNIEKLRARYPEGFDKARSINRNDERTYTLEEVKAELGIDADCTMPPCEDKEKAADSEKVHKKTYLEDFLERVPFAQMLVDECPKACRNEIYCTEECEAYSNCTLCWKETMPEEE